MPNTTSLSFPNMFNVAQNCVSVLEDKASVVNRTRLLMLTEPTELYNCLDQGVGMRKHLWKYNTDNERAILLDNVKKQLSLHEPCCVPEDTEYADGLLFTGGKQEYDATKFSSMEVTLSVKTTFADRAVVTVGSQDVELR